MHPRDTYLINVVLPEALSASVRKHEFESFDHAFAFALDAIILKNPSFQDEGTVVVVTNLDNPSTRIKRVKPAKVTLS